MPCSMKESYTTDLLYSMVLMLRANLHLLYQFYIGCKTRYNVLRKGILAVYIAWNFLTNRIKNMKKELAEYQWWLKTKRTILDHFIYQTKKQWKEARHSVCLHYALEGRSSMKESYTTDLLYSMGLTSKANIPFLNTLFLVYTLLP